MHTRLYRNGVLEKEGFPLEAVSDYLEDPDNVVWFDLCSPAPADLGMIGEELGLHELVTVRESDHFDITDVVRRWDANARLAGQGVSFLLHGLLDYIVDTHFDLVQDLDGKAEALEEAPFEDEVRDGRQLQREMYVLRKNTARLRKITIPMREVLGTLRRHDQELITDAVMAPYYDTARTCPTRAPARPGGSGCPRSWWR
ncbi:CorA family divalent cation transporter [Nonomuraea turkmeniaca]|uniref:CorA family divalent cation transporter n=1 Tax=Nonomuraea turkmeniaca TaxID=103838 RepID=UPI001FE638E3|nr:CorA family divalent cation transporter [Nonomuraea turkmeniaca]